MRGLALEKSGRSDKALADYKQALTLDPAHRIAADGLKRLSAAPEPSLERSEIVAIDKPRIGDLRLDWCREWSQKCGKAAADEFCRRQGLRRQQHSQRHRPSVRQPSSSAPVKFANNPGVRALPQSPAVNRRPRRPPRRRLRSLLSPLPMTGPCATTSARVVRQPFRPATAFWRPAGSIAGRPLPYLSTGASTTERTSAQVCPNARWRPLSIPRPRSGRRKVQSSRLRRMNRDIFIG